MLPKIHKKGTPGRPICSTVCHPTCQISKWVDKDTQKYAQQADSYIKDTTDFILKLKELPELPKDSLLVTLDVTSLYTNIPNEEGLRATFRKLLRDPNMRQIRPYIIKLIILVLTNTNFTFNGEHYLQVGGTSMGTGFTPSYASIFMAWFEEEAIKNYPLKPLFWKRFIDDVFCIWTQGKKSLINL